MATNKKPTVGPLLGHQSYKANSATQRILIRGRDEWTTQVGFIRLRCSEFDFDRLVRVPLRGANDAGLPAERDLVGVATISDIPLNATIDYWAWIRDGTPSLASMQGVSAGSKGQFSTRSRDQRELSFLMGSCCHFPLIAGTTRADDRAFEVMVKRFLGDDFLLMMGDQIYGDHRITAKDFKVPLLRTVLQTLSVSKKKLRFDHYTKHYRRAFTRKAKRRVMASMPVYMTWDDHEVINNWAGGSMERGFWTAKQEHEHVPEADPDREREASVERKKATHPVLRAGVKAYSVYQASHSPLTPSQLFPATDRSPRFDYQFTRGRCDFFVMDVRYERERAEGKMMSRRQMRALEEFVKRGNDRIKFIVTAVPMFPDSDRSILESDPNEKWTGYEDERNSLLEAIRRESRNGNRNFIFLTGDVHCSFVTRLRHAADPNFEAHQITSSAFNWGIGLNEGHFRDRKPLYGSVAYEPRIISGKAITRDNFCRVEVEEEAVQVHFYAAKSGRRLSQHSVSIPLR